HVHPPNLPSFPTRRSSDLTSRREGAEACAPQRVTEIAAAAFAKRKARSSGAPSAKATASPALNVSPAAVVSATSTANEGEWRCRDRKSTRLNSSHVSISYA